MLSRLFRKCIRRPDPASPYSYIPGPRDLGIGVGNEALVRPHPYPTTGKWGPRYNVQKPLDVHARAFVLPAQSLPNVDLKANGVALSGTWALTPLSGNEDQ